MQIPLVLGGISSGWLPTGHCWHHQSHWDPLVTSPKKYRQFIPTFHSKPLRWGLTQEKLLKEMMVSLGEMPAFLRTSNNLSESRRTVFLWAQAFLYAGLIIIKAKRHKPLCTTRCSSGAAPPKSVGMVFIWEFLRVNICQNTPGFELCQSGLLWLQALQTGTALLPLVKLVPTHKTQKYCLENTNLKF